MWTVAQADLIPIIIALLIGIATGWWIFRTVRKGSRAPDGTAETAQGTSAPVSRPPRDGAEGNAITDQAAAATADVAGEILGVDAHPNIAGPNGPPDDLQILKGVGPKLASQLGGFGITRFDQLAALSANEVAIIDDKLGAFRGRLTRDRIVEQATYLARGDRDGFEAKFGKLGG